MKRLEIALALTLLFLAVSFCSAQQDKASPSKDPKDNSVYAELARAPEKARAKRNPFEHDLDAIAAGRNLFEQHCSECHGALAEGGKKGPSLRAEEVQSAEPGAIFWILTNGVVRKGMPVWSKLPEAQRWQLITYLKSLGTVPAKAAEPKVVNPQPLVTESLLPPR